MKRQAVSSSNIRSVGHGLVDGVPTLEVEFKYGSVYQYPDVDETVMNEILSASSAGRFFNNWKRGKEYVRVS